MRDELVTKFRVNVMHTNGMLLRAEFRLSLVRSWKQNIIIKIPMSKVISDREIKGVMLSITLNIYHGERTTLPKS